MTDHDEHSVPPPADEWAAVLDSLHVPEDAGEHRRSLIGLLLRIPPGWGRWVGCDAGWFGLLVDLDADLAGMDPEYTLEQAKEKYGGLRYCADTSLKDAALRDAFYKRIAAAERESMSVCERCACPGFLHERDDWLRTLCPDCAQALGYPPSPRV